jgi:AmmeMemoRadiSam system protein B
MQSAKVRKATFAGSWYPSSASECERKIRNYIESGAVSVPAGAKWTGGIVPHAGWFFSGSIACNVIRYLKDENSPDTVVVFGMHLNAEDPCYMMAEGAWQTPFGDLMVDEELAAELTGKFSFILETPDNFAQDNTIELQLPFIKYFFGETKVLAMGVPPHKRSLEIGRAVAEISKKTGRRIKVIGSTDLTHYGYNYGLVSKGTGEKAVQWVRNENDRRVITAMLDMDPEKVIAEARANQNACCAGAAATAIETAKDLGVHSAAEIAYATSYDKSPGDSFVGYVGIVF